MTENEKLIEYYTNLLILQYRQKDKAQGTIKALTRLIMIFELMKEVENGYDVETAVGVQQDVLGKYIGPSRVITGTTFDRDYYWYLGYTDTPTADQYGFTGYGETPPDAQYRSYSEDNQSLYSLNDAEYREILKLGIILNSSNLSTRETDTLVNDFFDGNVKFNDRFNMTISYIFNESQRRLVEIAQSQGLIPKAMAVGVSISFADDPSKLYSYVGYGEEVPSGAVGFAGYGEEADGSWLGY